MSGSGLGDRSSGLGTRSRHATTFVELVVMSALGVVVLGALYLLFSAGSRQGGRMEEKMQGVQSAQLLLEHLRDDVTAALVGPGKPMRVESIADGKRNRLTFERYDPSRQPEGTMPTRHVVYLFEPATHRVLRDGEPILGATFASVEFQWVPSDGSGASPSNVLTVVLTSAPAELLARGGDLDPRSTSTFSETLAVNAVGPKDPLRSWMPNFYVGGQ